MVQLPFTDIDPLTVRKAAKQLHVSRVTVYDWIRREKIYSIRFGGLLFIPQSEIERLQNHEQPNATP